MGNNSVQVRVGADLANVKAQLESMGLSAQSAAETGALGFHSLRGRVVELTQAVALLRNAIREAHDPAQVAQLTSALADESAKLTAARGELRGMRMGSLEANEGLMMMSETLGVHIPFGMTRIASRLPEIRTLMEAAFPLAMAGLFVGGLVEVAGKVKDVALELGGYTKAVQEAEAADAKASEAALTHFKTVAEGYALIAETNRRLAELDAQNAGIFVRMAAAGGTASKSWWSLIPGIGTAIALYTSFGKVTDDNTSAQAKLREQLVAQLDQLTHVTTEQARLNLEILKAKDAAEAAGRSRSQQLKLQLSELQAEEDIEVREAAANQDKISAIHEIYKQRRIRIEGEITAEVKKEQEKRLKAEGDFNEELIRESAKWERDLERTLNEAKKAEETAIKDLGKMKFPIPALPPDTLAPLISGFHQLTEAERAALPLSNDLGMAVQREALRLRELRQEMDGGTLPAVKRIDTAYHTQMNTARQQLQLMQQEYQQRKITRAQMEAAEEAYTEIVVNSAALRTGAMKQEALQQASTIANMLGLEQEFVIAQAAYWIPKDLALGFGALGAGDFWSATQYFLGAAQWGAAAGKAVSTIASGGGGGSKGSAAGSSAGGNISGGSSGQQTTNSVIRVELPPGGQIPVAYVRELINQINTQTQFNGVTLHATYARSLARRA